MRALQITDLIGPDGVTVMNDAPEPTDDGRSVIVETAFAGVSFPDLLQTRGMYQIRLSSSQYLVVKKLLVTE